MPRSCRSTVRSCRSRRDRSETRRSGTAGRSAARSRTAILRPTSRRSSSRSTRRWSYAGRASGSLPAAGLLHRRLPDGSGGRRDARRDPGAEARTVDRLVVHEDGAPGPGLGHGRGRRGRRALERIDRERIDRAHEHGRDAVRARAAEEAIASGTAIDEAADLIGEGTNPPSDQAASAEFRRHLARGPGEARTPRGVRGLGPPGAPRRQASELRRRPARSPAPRRSRAPRAARRRVRRRGSTMSRWRSTYGAISTHVLDARRVTACEPRDRLRGAHEMDQRA